ncbi:hypothetical protein H1C71_012058, partial [Ictidomys tridecemlineatus]
GAPTAREPRQGRLHGRHQTHSSHHHSDQCPGSLACILWPPTAQAGHARTSPLRVDTTVVEPVTAWVLVAKGVVEPVVSHLRTVKLVRRGILVTQGHLKGGT